MSEPLYNIDACFRLLEARFNLALLDLQKPDSEIRREAHEFLESDAYDWLCVLQIEFCTCDEWRSLIQKKFPRTNKPRPIIWA